MQDTQCERPRLLLKIPIGISNAFTLNNNEKIDQNYVADQVPL
jgi:hypothetical protein